MRTVKLQVQISVDGFIAGEKGEMDWMIGNWGDDLKDYLRKITEPVDCVVLGRKLAQGFIPYWASHPEQEGADKINSFKKVVFTNTLHASDPEVKGWKNTVLAKGDLVEEITALKKQGGKDIIVYGGAGFVSSLIKENLIDEYHLLVNPTAIGKGMPIFNTLTGRQDLDLVKSESFDCGIVLLYYKPKR